MALEVLHNLAATHENEQFRRVVAIMDTAFDKLGFNGILIGNPFNSTYRRFRADAILLYDRGAVIIDFKEYSGQLILPNGELEFTQYAWYAEDPTNRQAIEVKGGAHFLNPFLQLGSYRNAFREIVEHNPILRREINPSRVCIANIFSGPLDMANGVPGRYPYYKIVQECEIGQFLYDLNNDNAYTPETAAAIKAIFPADEYIRVFETIPPIISKDEIVIESSAKDAIDMFIQSEKNDILVLTSMDQDTRDDWSRYLFAISDDYKVPQMEAVCHSTRISRRLQHRGIEANSLYSVVYGGSSNDGEISNVDMEDEASLQVVPIKTDTGFDDHAIVIVEDAHLVNRSLAQSDLMRFGSGRLLEDFMTFIGVDSPRKIVFIGDPYMLSYGSIEDSALCIPTLQEICENRTIRCYCQPIQDDSANDIVAFRKDLASAIDKELFNKLDCNYSDGTVEVIERESIVNRIREWFCIPFTEEPDKAILFFKKADCYQTNIWIKANCLRNGRDLAEGDLLITNNNICIPDPTGFGNPQRLLNGMYLTVNRILGHESRSISIKGYDEPVILSFTKIDVTCLSLNRQRAEIWILDNYLRSDDELSKVDQIAMRVLLNSIIYERTIQMPFRDSVVYSRMLSDKRYQSLEENNKQDIEFLIENKTLKKEDRHPVSTTKEVRSLLRHFYSAYLSSVHQFVTDNDPFANALYAKYGWTITVHKALGVQFDEVIVKGYRGENIGNANDDYFRWLYSAISNAKNKLSITHPQIITPYQNCRVQDIAGTAKAKSISLLTFDGFEIPERFSSLVSALNANSAAAIAVLSLKLEKGGFILESTARCSDYLSKAMYSIPSDINRRLVIDVNNKGPKDAMAVSSIRIEPLNAEFDKPFIESSIKDMFYSQPIRENTAQTCPDYMDEVYSEFIADMALQGLIIKRTGGQAYQDVFSAVSSNGEAGLRFWYGTSKEQHSRGFISKIEVFDASDPQITDTIKSYVLGKQQS